MTFLNPKQYGLALHTTSSQLGLSLSDFDRDCRTQTWHVDRELSTYLHQCLVQFLGTLTWQDIAFIAVAKGPGSFTSSRIGVVTARTLAQQLDIPLFAISTLAALALSQCDRISSQQTIAVQMNATQGRLYAAIYQIFAENSSLIAYLPDTVMTAADWQETIEKLAFPYKLVIAPTDLGTTVDSLLAIAYQAWQAGKRPHWSAALPFYE